MINKTSPLKYTMSLTSIIVLMYSALALENIFQLKYFPKTNIKIHILFKIPSLSKFHSKSEM